MYAPGTTQKYSNAAIATVGYLLEKRSGIPFATYLQRAVLEPMGRTSAAFAPTPTLLAHVPQAEMWTCHERTVPAPTFALGMAPAGSMYSTMPDLGRFLSVLFVGGMGAHGRVVKASTLDSMWVPQFSGEGATRGSGLGFVVSSLDGRRFARQPVATVLPADVPARWRGLIGEYGWDHDVLYILESNGRLSALIEWFFEYPLTEVSENVYAFPRYGLYAGERIAFVRDARGRATIARAAGVDVTRRTWVGEDGGIFRITPVKPVPALRAALCALRRSPPHHRWSRGRFVRRN